MKKVKVKNLDYEFHLNVVKQHSEHQEDWLKVGYAPRGYYLKDFCLIKEKGVWHLFHITGTPGVSCAIPGNEIFLGHATTKDFKKWTTHFPCFYIDPVGWDCGLVAAPYVVKDGGRFWMYYLGADINNTQRIGVAVSDDLFTWKRATKKPVITPEKYGWAFCPTTKGAACRDPHLCKIGDEWVMYYTAVTKEGRGCVGIATSKDMIRWKDRGVAYAAPTLAHCESSNMQKLGDKYLLFFGGHYEYWSYVISDNPWRWPDQAPIPLKKGITGMEVVERKDSIWTVAYFRFDPMRLFLGTIDWSKKKPTVKEIRN